MFEDGSPQEPEEVIERQSERIHALVELLVGLRILGRRAGRSSR